MSDVLQVTLFTIMFVLFGGTLYFLQNEKGESIPSPISTESLVTKESTSSTTNLALNTTTSTVPGITSIEQIPQPVSESGTSSKFRNQETDRLAEITKKEDVVTVPTSSKVPVLPTTTKIDKYFFHIQ